MKILYSINAVALSMIIFASTSLVGMEAATASDIMKATTAGLAEALKVCRKSNDPEVCKTAVKAAISQEAIKVYVNHLTPFGIIRLDNASEEGIWKREVEPALKCCSQRESSAETCHLAMQGAINSLFSKKISNKLISDLDEQEKINKDHLRIVENVVRKNLSNPHFAKILHERFYSSDAIIYGWRRLAANA